MSNEDNNAIITELESQINDLKIEIEKLKKEIEEYKNFLNEFNSVISGIDLDFSDLEGLNESAAEVYNGDETISAQFGIIAEVARGLSVGGISAQISSECDKKMAEKNKKIEEYESQIRQKESEILNLQ